MITIQLSNIIHSVDSALERNKFYDASKFDDLIDELTDKLKILESTSIVKKLPKETNFIIDRFESEFAVCENQLDRKMYNIHKSILDPNAKEGSSIRRCGDIYLIDSTKNKKTKGE